jgi:MOSC domain-containing protein YiiM
MTVEARHLTMDELEAGLQEIMRAPRDAGVLEMIVRRPDVGEREVLFEAQLDVDDGLVGDNWALRHSTRPPNREAQLTLMNVRVAALVAQERDRWPLAGDQLYVDLDLSEANLRAGTRLRIGTAVVEVSALPHTGCAKFVARFGQDAMTFVNAPRHRELRLRGMNTRIVQSGGIHVGDSINRLD